jgi:hypothetical protein
MDILNEGPHVTCLPWSPLADRHYERASMRASDSGIDIEYRVEQVQQAS